MGLMDWRSGRSTVNHRRHVLQRSTPLIEIAREPIDECKNDDRGWDHLEVVVTKRLRHKLLLPQEE